MRKLVLMILVLSLTLFAASALAEVQGERALIVYFTHEGNNDFAGDSTLLDAITSASVQRNGASFPPQLYNGIHMGNTQIVANYIAQHTGAELFAIEPIEAYPLDAYETLDVAQGEYAQNARPALKTQVEQMDAYDTIYLCYPIWYGTMPMPVFTFLEAYDFTGKTIIPISTHDGSGLGSSKRDIQSLCPNATVLDGLAIRYSDIPNAQDEVSNWLDQIR